MPADTPTPLWGLWSDKKGKYHGWYRSLADANGFRSREEAEMVARGHTKLRYRPVLLVPTPDPKGATDGR